MANEENKNNNFVSDSELLIQKNNNSIDAFSDKELLNLEIKNQKNLKEIILSYMNTFAYSDSKIPSNMVDSVIRFLQELKQALTYCNENIDKLNSIIKELETKKYTNSYNDILIEILQKNLKIEKCIYKTTKMTDFKFYKQPSKKEITPSETTPFTENEVIEDVVNNNDDTKELNENMQCNDTKEIEYNKNIQDNDTKEIEHNKNAKFNDTKGKKHDKNIISNNTIESVANKKENCLVISETRSKVILPYLIDTLNKKMQNNPGKYSSIDEIIAKEYTIPLSRYKNPIVSRFREAFKLMRIKEKSSIAKAFDLGMELTFNYNLHPAIISACRNLDELDIYLDCLENEETDKFKCFDIVFEIPPMIIRKH